MKGASAWFPVRTGADCARGRAASLFPGGAVTLGCRLPGPLSQRRIPRAAHIIGGVS